MLCKVCAHQSNNKIVATNTMSDHLLNVSLLRMYTASKCLT